MPLHLPPATPNPDERPVAGAASGGAASGRSGRGRHRVSPRLVALSSAAILAVYGAGYVRTQAATEQVARQEGQAPASVRTPAAPTPSPQRSIPQLQQRPTFPDQRGDDGLRERRRHFDDDEDEHEGGRERGDRFGQSTPSAPGAVPSTPRTPPSSNPAPNAAPQAIPKPGTYRDGTYTGMGVSRHGPIEAMVVVRSGKIVSADITQCGTRYPCSKVAHLPDEVLTTQGPPVDWVSGATESSQAYTDAIRRALAQAG